MENTFEKWIKDCIGYNEGFKLQEYQLIKIKEKIDYVKEHSKFYREKFKDISSKDIFNLDDFARLISFTNSEDLSLRPKDFLCVPQHEISRIITLKTSGTVGNNKRIFFTEKDLERTIDFFHHGMKFLVDPGDKVLILMPGDYYGSIGDLLKKGLNRLGCEGIILGIINDNFKVLDILMKEKIDCIVGLPIQIYELGRVKSFYKKYKDIKLKTVLMSGDYVPNSIKKVVEKGFNCKVLTHYGMTEMGFGGGVECSCQNGYYLREGDLYFEIIDPVTGNLLPLGEEGEVVFTTLTREGMPLIRYKTGDIASFSEKLCKCNIILPRMNYVKGRIGEQVNIGDSSFYIGDIDEIIYTIDNLLDYEIRINKDTLQIWTKSLDKRYSVGEKEIKRAIKNTNMEELCLEYCGEIGDIQVYNSMFKRKIL